MAFSEFLMCQTLSSILSYHQGQRLGGSISFEQSWCPRSYDSTQWNCWSPRKSQVQGPTFVAESGDSQSHYSNKHKDNYVFLHDEVMTLVWRYENNCTNWRKSKTESNINKERSYDYTVAILDITIQKVGKWALRKNYMRHLGKHKLVKISRIFASFTT